MARDHYVSQVHLRNFYPPGKTMLHAINKENMKEFECPAKAVCFVEEGSTNEHLSDQRCIEKLLPLIENKYNASVQKLRKGRPDDDAIYVIAGFVSFVQCCAPAFMRVYGPLLHNSLRTAVTSMERHGLIDVEEMPSDIDAKTLSELIDKDFVKVGIDPKYAQARGIINFKNFLSARVGSNWEILINTKDNNPFFTSDYPFVMEQVGHSIFNAIAPLAPDIAVRIKPPAFPRQALGAVNSLRSRIQYPKISRHEILEINRLIIRSAEKFVFFRDNYEWIRRFVKKNLDYRVDLDISRTEFSDSVEVSAQYDLRKHQRPSAPELLVRLK